MRLRVEQNDFTSQRQLVDDRYLVIVAGDDVDFDLGVSKDFEWDEDPNLSDVTVEIRSADKQTTYFTHQGPSTTSTTKVNWDAGTHQHVSVEVPSAKTTLAPRGRQSLLIYATGTGGRITLSSGYIRVI